MASKQTLEQLLSHLGDDVLYAINQELDTGFIPASGQAHSFCRRVNRLIDQGKLSVNPNTYRKVYLPTLYKAINVEMARRYMHIIDKSKPIEYQPVQVSLDDVIKYILTMEVQDGNKAM